MKKLKAWQVVLLVIFYPIGIIYLIVWLCNRNKQPAATPAKKFDISAAVVERDFHTKVAGVSFNNDNGTSRQEIIKRCTPGDDVVFKPMPTKAYPETIGVFTMKGEQIGVLNAQLAKEMHSKYATSPMSAAISGINGGDNGKYLGVNLHITIYEK